VESLVAVAAVAAVVAAAASMVLMCIGFSTSEVFVVAVCFGVVIAVTVLTVAATAVIDGTEVCGMTCGSAMS
jgi:hypothetical protein